MTTAQTVRAELKPDREMLGRFCDLMFKRADRSGVVSLRAFPDAKSSTGKEKPILVETIRLDDPVFLDIVVERARQAAAWDEPAVYCPPVASFRNNQSAKVTNLKEGIVLLAECDERPSAARLKLEALLGTATAVIASGGEWTDQETGEVQPKLHLYWRLKTPTAKEAEHNKLREARELATALVDGDPTAISIVHPTRWAGSWHRKNTPKLATIVASSDDNEIDLDDALKSLREAFDVVSEASGAAAFVSAGVKATGRLRAADDAYVVSALTVIPNGDNDDWGRWNDVGLKTFAATGGSEVGRRAFHDWSAKSKKYNSVETDVRWDHYKASPPTKAGFGSLVYLARKHSPGWTFSASATVPVVKFGPLSVMADRAAEILIEAKVPFYQRGSKLVRPVVLPADTFGGKTTSVVQLVEVDLHYLRDTLCRHSKWVKYDKRSKSWLDIHPPTDVAMILLKKFGDWKFPILAGIITTPTLRPDGTILSSPGYDAATKLLLVDPPSMPDIPDRPTKENAQQALGFLKELLVEFPFVDDVSRSVGLSAQISTVCRGAYLIMPMHVVDAPAAGSGKSYLLSTISWIATGQDMPVISAGKSEEEMEKRLGAAVIRGQPLICIDNVVGELGGDALCQLVEQSRPSVRVLGMSQLVDVDARSTSYFADGNNIVIVGDMYRRTIHSRLDAQVERPELRTFKSNPRTKILADRGAYIAACLTISRAYIVAGRPDKCPQLGSFGDWSDTVRSALVWCGEADPVASMDASKAEDPETTALLNVLTEWSAVFGVGPTKGQTLRDVVEFCERPGDFLNQAMREAVLAIMPPQHRNKPDVHALGSWMRRQKSKRISKMWFDSKAGTHGAATRWWVESKG
ncbi:PriCT-2 domain-containing protein [Bradyrhizobium japonicum]|uniref:PriCT-2 domain-containing protein n=1 Tax=Bradyrhizobium japonicum TaxID=375 RepID=UPI0027154441|nr:PriCT-2 domain-containing protein [Bradyrhizobium japonicum]WLB64669.1 PriCT-2 domain-containing protein [Bradyrhizobium japonicum]